jgi:hypothetical protein
MAAVAAAAAAAATYDWAFRVASGFRRVIVAASWVTAARVIHASRVTAARVIHASRVTALCLEAEDWNKQNHVISFAASLQHRCSIVAASLQHHCSIVAAS